MTITVFPLDAVSGAPTYTGQMVRQALSVFCGVAPSGRPLGAVSGVRQGTPTSTVSATTSTWTCRPHSGLLDLEVPAAAGPYLYSSDANVTGSVTAADASNARVDIVYVQLNDPAESDGSTVPGALIQCLAGTPSGSPSPPATPARSIVLAQINVPASGGGSPTVTWVAPYINTGIGVLRSRSTTASIPGTNASTPINTWDTAEYNAGDITYGSGIYTVNTAGLYMVLCSVAWPASTATHVRSMKFNVNGAEPATHDGRSDFDYFGSVSNRVLSTSGLLQLAQGDQVQAVLSQSSGTSMTVTLNSFGLVKVG